MHAVLGSSAARLAGYALRAAIASIVILWPMVAQPQESSCKLTQQQKSSAVKAFTRLYPIYQDERCLNCHGAVNPFAPSGDHGGGWVNIREAARKFLATANLPADLVMQTDADRAAELQDLRELAAGRDEDIVSDRDLIRRKYSAAMKPACKECHVAGWDIPMSFNYFTDRTWKQICKHMKTGLAPPTPDQFLHHMQEDDLILLGFRGQKGLKTPTSAEPPSMPFATMVKHANDWVDAMDAKFHRPAECGCEVDGIALEIRHRIYTDPQSGSAKAGFAQFDGAVVIDMVLQREEGEGDAIFRDEQTVLRTVAVKHVTPSFWKCEGSGKREEFWQVSARLDEENESLLLHFSFTEEAAEAQWTCKARGHTLTDPVYIDLFGIIDTLTMPAKAGSVGEISRQRDKTVESYTVTVIDSPVAQ